MTQKLQANVSDTEDEEDGKTAQIPQNDPDNIWTQPIKTSVEIADFVSSYKKFWEEENKKQKVEKEKDSSVVMNGEKGNRNRSLESDDSKEEKEQGSKCLVRDKVVKKTKHKIAKVPKKLICENQSGDWNIEERNENVIVVDDVFHDLEKQLHEKLQKKLKRTKASLKTSATIKNNYNNKKRKNIDYLHIPKKQTHPIIDEPLQENTKQTDQTAATQNQDLINLQKIISEQPPATKKTNIEPNKPNIETKAVNIKTDLPDIFTTEDNNSEDEDPSQQLSDPFIDDDVAEEFSKEKSHEIEDEKPKDVDLSLPGWGSWGGKGIAVSKRKQKRFIVRFPKKMKRRDENKGALVINEARSAKVREHQVSEVPFPFKTVKDFEASVRAPIGREFVPENAFRKLIAPAVRTKMGTIIQPMTEEVLLKVKEKSEK